MGSSEMPADVAKETPQDGRGRWISSWAGQRAEKHMKRILLLDACFLLSFDLSQESG